MHLESLFEGFWHRYHVSNREPVQGVTARVDIHRFQFKVGQETFFEEGAAPPHTPDKGLALCKPACCAKTGRVTELP